MVGDVVENVIKLIYYVVPGFIALRVFRFFIPCRDTSDFRILVSSLIWSLLILTSLVGLQNILPKILDCKIQWNFASGERIYFLVSIPFGLFTAWIFAGIFKSKWFSLFLEKIGVNYTVAPSVWGKVMEMSKGNEYWVKVTLRNGKMYLGYPRYCTSDPNDTEKELFLEHAYLIKDNDYVKIEGKGVLLTKSELTSVEFIEGKPKGKSS